MKFGDESTVVDMCVREKHEIDLFGVKKKWFIIELHDFFGSLEHPAVDEKFEII